jgi:hypothetical protein
MAPILHQKQQSYVATKRLGNFCTGLLIPLVCVFITSLFYLFDWLNIVQNNYYQILKHLATTRLKIRGCMGRRGPPVWESLEDNTSLEVFVFVRLEYFICILSFMVKDAKPGCSRT